MSESIEKQIEKVLTTDGRTKLFKEKLKKLGYAKIQAKKINKVMEKTGDFGMMSDAGNKKVARAVSQSKNEKELRAKLEKIATMAKGKYSEAQEDDVIQRAINALDDKSSGSQAWADKNVMVQMGSLKDLDRVKTGEISTNDMKKTKVKRDDAVKVYDTLMKVKAPIRTKYLQLLQKDSKSFKKTFNAILKVAHKLN
mgnify:CR=1 FL=1|tara:strand:- start:7475 stop:8065 length:591 start_codon:yes stop_codon:yes gene_type:complete